MIVILPWVLLLIIVLLSGGGAALEEIFLSLVGGLLKFLFFVAVLFGPVLWLFWQYGSTGLKGFAGIAGAVVGGLVVLCKLGDWLNWIGGRLGCTRPVKGQTPFGL
jgi:hypothetical protein